MFRKKSLSSAKKEPKVLINKLDLNDFICAVCLELPLEPSTLSCGHTFCIDCVKTTDCPICRTTLYGTRTINFNLKAFLQKNGDQQYQDRLVEHQKEKMSHKYWDSKVYHATHNHVYSFVKSSKTITFTQLQAVFKQIPKPILIDIIVDIYYQSNKILIINENLIHKVEFKDRIDNLLAIINRLNITITDVELAFLHILSSHKNTALNQLDQYLENTQLRPYFEKYSFCRTPDYQDDFYQIVSKLSETNLKNPNYFINTDTNPEISDAEIETEDSYSEASEYD